MRHSTILYFFMLALVLVGSTGVEAAGAGEREFPARQIEVVYPWDPGETGYAVSQVVGRAMTEALGETVVVTSTTGAAGVRAATQVLGRPADGYTVFDGYVAPLVMAPLQGNADYTYEDWKPLYGLAANGFAIASRPDEDRWSDLAGLIEYAQNNPGEIRMGSSPAQSLPSLVAASLFQQADAPVRLVPYPGAEGAFSDFQSGDLDIQVITSGLYRSQKDNLRVTTVLNMTRLVDEGAPGSIPGPLVSDFGFDLGLSGLGAMGWTWWVVPGDTPDDVVAILREAMFAAVSDPEVQERISNLGFIPLDPADYAPEDYNQVVSQIEQELSGALEAIVWLQNVGN
jgi:tripartite-type tricarboxylate transporter receptor subunit TctC